jgi:hypothetical protein
MANGFISSFRNHWCDSSDFTFEFFTLHVIHGEFQEMTEGIPVDGILITGYYIFKVWWLNNITKGYILLLSMQ